MPGWIHQQCPERGPGLTHAHWASCHPSVGHPPDGGAYKDKPVEFHSWGTCCHCGLDEAADKAIRERLAAIGLPSDIPLDDRDPVLVEPKFIDGKGAKGPLRGAEKHVVRYEPAHGRLPFTVEDQRRLLFFIGDQRPGAILEVNARISGVLDPPPAAK